MALLRLTAPGSDELEITLIGPSVGEGVVLHYQGNWFVIDSCIDKQTKLPSARAYLESIGVQPTSVRIVACTHWHDDHMKGLGEFFKWAPSAQLWMSGALRRREFVDAIEAWKNAADKVATLSGGLEELTSAVDEARTRGTPPNFAHHDQRMWQSADGSAELWSLSPSAATIVKSFEQIAALVPADWAQQHVLVDKNPNHWAVAMHFRAGPYSILLGSDLEEENDPQTGWSAILASGARPQQQAGLYKVAHHGSTTGHHDGIWTTLLNEMPISIITPFSRSSLPRPEDIQRIKERSENVFLSAVRLQENKRKGAAAKLIAKKGLRPIDGPCGRIRARINTSVPGAAWQIELDSPAEQL